MNAAAAEHAPESLLSRYDVPGPRYTSYPTAPEWSETFGPEAYEERLRLAGRVDPAVPLSLYVHLPFCKELCTYCGCNVVVSKNQQRADGYLDHVALELALAAERLGPRRSVSQIHWGGGTPTFLSEAQLERLWTEITRHFTPLPEAEIAIEIDPAVTTEGQLALLRRLGFNRLSMGVQDLDPRVQQAVNRIQTYEETKGMLDLARSLGFGGVNFDLIYGLPHQTPESWQRTLEPVIGLRPDRAAVYSFAYVPEVRTNQRKLQGDAIPRGQVKLELLRRTQATFAAAGYRQIGMDHYALPGDELSVAQRERRLGRNFQGYTVKKATDCVAFGATGISELQGAFAQNVRPLPRYYAAVKEGRFATERGLLLTSDDLRRKQVITQLMCNFWVDLGTDGGSYFERELENLRAHERDGLVRIDGTQVEVTQLGRTFVRNVAMQFDAYLARPSGGRSFSRTV